MHPTTLFCCVFHDFIFVFQFIYFMHLDVLSACISMYQIQAVIGDQQRDPLGLEVQRNVLFNPRFIDY